MLNLSLIHISDHVEHRRHAGASALEQPDAVVVGGQAPATELGGPVEAGPPGLGQPALPVESGVDEIGWTDGPVVTRRMPAVRRQPCRCIRLELVDRDHLASMAKRHAGSGTVGRPV